MMTALSWTQGSRSALQAHSAAMPVLWLCLTTLTQAVQQTPTDIPPGTRHPGYMPGRTFVHTKF